MPPAGPAAAVLGDSLPAMTTLPLDVRATLARAAAAFHESGNRDALEASLRAVVSAGDAASLIAAVEPFRDQPEIAGPVYERVVALDPENARALVILANAWWLTGRGPEAVGELASRALAADPANRGAWHLWALTEPSPRRRTARWEQVSARFPEDDLARASFADNATSLASAESDPVALRRAIAAYEDLLARAQHPDQRDSLEHALRTLRGWRL